MIVIKTILIKEYREFGADADSGDLNIIAKEVEAIIALENGSSFSVGFSVTRENNLFLVESPRDMVREFLRSNFKL